MNEYLDNPLANYLDAELCLELRPSFTSGREGKSDDLVKLFSLESINQFKICLYPDKGNERWTDSLNVTDQPRTALAVARICLWLDYRQKTPKHDRHELEHESSQSSNPARRWVTIAENLINTTEPTVSDKVVTWEWQIDWARAQWQRIHYMAREPLSEKPERRVNEINAVYKQVWPHTVAVLQHYIGKDESEEYLHIDSDWLLVWLVSNVLFSKRLNRYFGLPMTNEEEPLFIANDLAKIRFLLHLSHHILYALHCVRYDRRKSEAREDRQSRFRRPPFADVPSSASSVLSESLLYVLSEYAYREIEIHRELCIFERLRKQLYYELPLYSVGNFYRDHLYHVMDVCLLGELLLRSILHTEGTNTIVARKLARRAENMPCDQLMQNWYVAALCHDLGYVVEKAKDFLNPVHDFQAKGIEGFQNSIQEGVSHGEQNISSIINQIIHSDLCVIPSMQTARSLLATINPTDHGMIAWLYLYHWLKEVKYPLDLLVPALTAILRHNLSEQRINIDDEPVSLLLMLCDHLQEWGRPRVGPTTLATGIAESLRFSEAPEFDRKVHVLELRIRGLKPRTLQFADVPQEICNTCRCSCGDKAYCLRTNISISGETTDSGESLLTINLPHGESREANFEPGVSWLLFCRDLQCCASKHWTFPFGITIALEHAPPLIWRTLPWEPREMDILEEFANTYEPAAYLTEWIQFARSSSGQEGIKYEYKGDGIETFTIDLHRLGRPLQRGLPNKIWQDFIKWKWRWLSRKFIDLNLGNWFPELEQ